MPRWTEEEISFLRNYWGILSVRAIAKKLGRSYASVMSRKQLLGLPPTTEANGDLINISEVCRLLDVEFNTVFYCWHSHGLKLIAKRVSEKMTYWYINPKDLLDFLKDHQDRWDSRNLPENILGTEPAWLREKRLYDYDNPPVKMHFWTTLEVIRAEKLYDQGLNNNEIAQKLGITANQVRKLLHSLGYDTNFARKRVNQDIEFMSINYPSMSIEEIANQLSRTIEYVEEKLEALGLLGNQYKMESR